jgi:anti-sigma regulatory factor (Ser/Thr protein kinase)
VRTAYNEVVTELLAASLGSGELPGPAVIVNALHAKLTPRLIELDAFVTMALYRFDLMAGTMIYVNAGHTAGIIVGADGVIASVLGENLPVGVLPDERYVEKSRPIRAGDALLAYSDGVTEARNQAGVQFGEDRLNDLLAAMRPHDLPPNILLQALHRTVRRFAGTDEMLDDQSAVWVGVRSLAAGNVRAPAGQPESEVFDLPRASARLEPLRTRVGAAAAFLGAEAADGLVLAAFEAATNVVRHVASPLADAMLSCRITREAARVVVEIWYLGEPFQPLAEPQPDLTGASEGGFGLYIMSRAVTRVEHESPLPGICCTRLVQVAGERTAA